MMRAYFIHRCFLINAVFCIAILLTLYIALFQPIRQARAESDPPYIGSDQNPNNSLADEDRKQRLALISNYIKQQWQGWAPGLPMAIRNPSSWIKNALTPDDDSTLAPITKPMSVMIQTPAPEESKAAWFSSDYHHKGFLPLHDAMITGFNLRHPLFDTGLSLNAHPFYGQNWHDSEGYWGTEFALSFSGGDARTLSAQNPWGKLALRYSNGDTTLLDRGRGFDMHGDLNFDQHFSLRAGVNQTNQIEDGSYMMLRWKLFGE
jgi:hypothetical protein